MILFSLSFFNYKVGEPGKYHPSLTVFLSSLIVLLSADIIVVLEAAVTHEDEIFVTTLLKNQFFDDLLGTLVITSSEFAKCKLEPLLITSSWKGLKDLQRSNVVLCFH